METGIGPTLREARSRRKIDLAAVEDAIKIRARYLQAMENEEWDALPGGAYTRGFIRTYASYLGLDGERLAEDYRRATGPPGGERAPKRVEPVPAARRRRQPLVSGRLAIVAVCLVLVAVVIGIALAGGGGGSSSPTTTSGEGKQAQGKHAQAPAATTEPGVSVRLAARAEVWVCLLDAKKAPLVDGAILTEGAEAGPFRSSGFEVALGNGSVSMFVDGERADIPESSSPVGYRVDPTGKLIALEEGERPSCE